MNKEAKLTTLEGELERAIDKIEDDDLRLITKKYFATRVPSYFMHMTASGSKRYHPVEMNIEGGLIIHNLAMLEYMEEMMKPVSQTRLSPYARDVARVSALIHDTYKYGRDEEYVAMRQDNKVRALANHGHMAAVEFRKVAKDVLPSKTVDDICATVEKHMGVYDATLNQKMDTFYLLSVSDYVVSRRNHVSKEARRIAKKLKGKGFGEGEASLP